MKKIYAALAFIALVALTIFGAPTAASATGGSDAPTPYTVDETGITLPEGDTFRDNGHVNIKTEDGTQYGIHFEDRNWPVDHVKRYYIGKNSIPWAAFGIDTKHPYCIAWVQISHYNQHFGEGGQAPVGTGCKGNPPAPEVREASSQQIDCEHRIVVETWTEETRGWVWDNDTRSWVLGEWSEPIVTKTPQRPATEEECPIIPDLPETGGSTDAVLVSAVVGVGLLITGALLFRRRPVA